MLKVWIALVFYLVSSISSNKVDDVAQFVFKEYDLKETSKNVSYLKSLKKSINIFAKNYFPRFF